MIFQFDGLPVHYIDRGEGAPVLLLHGWMGNVESFAPLIRDLSARFRVVALDFPGQGGSTPEPPRPYTVGDHAEMVRALLSELKIERTKIVAHSFGGRVSLKLASESPELVEKMALTGCAGLLPKKTLKSCVRGALYGAVRGFSDNILKAEQGDKLREALVRRFGSTDYRALTPSMRPTFNLVVAEDLSYCLNKVSAPTVLVYGTEDQETPLWMGEKMAREMGDAALITFQGSGHFAYLEQYPKFLAIIGNFFG